MLISIGESSPLINTGVSTTSLFHDKKARDRTNTITKHKPKKNGTERVSES